MLLRQSHEDNKNLYLYEFQNQNGQQTNKHSM